MQTLAVLEKMNLRSTKGSYSNGISFLQILENGASRSWFERALNSYYNLSMLVTKLAVILIPFLNKSIFLAWDFKRFQLLSYKSHYVNISI